MADANNLEEYVERLRNALYMEGEGPRAVLHQPCPFCAAPDFLVCSISVTTATWLQGSHCAECGRGAKGVFTPRPGGVALEIVQTAGKDQPSWLLPKMRREWEAVGRG